MGEYLLASLQVKDDRNRGLSRELAELARAGGLKVTHLNETTWLATGGPNPTRLRQIGPWTLVGDILNRSRPLLPATAPDDPWSFERKMMARFWGRFIGLRFDGQGRLDGLLRDPSGALDCIAWEHEGLILACSHARDWLLERLRPDWRIDVERLGQALHDPLAGAGGLLIQGPVAVAPGAAQPLPLSTEPEVLWSPAQIAWRSLDPEPTPEEARARLRAAVDEAVGGFAGLPGRLAAEVSGGLDSSLVAASLVRSAQAPVALWLNAYGETPESDERVQAKAVGDGLGFVVHHAPHATRRLSPEALEARAEFRPNVALLDTPHDEAWADLILRSGADALLTGKGGDSIFVQAPSTEVFIDLWRAKGWRALLSPDMAELAASNEISLWTMAAAARREARSPLAPTTWDHPILTPLPRPLARHPWLEDCEAFGPAKTFQIAGVADSVSHNSPTALSDRVDVRNPLGAQPVVEACLALPTWTLTVGGRDRGLARAAFRDRLPAVVLDRRSKGDMTRLYSRLIVDNLDLLRPWLIEGRLAALGLIDPIVADVELTPETLMWRGRYAPLLAAIVFEGWLRRWERRLGPAVRSPPTPATAPASRTSA
ncbi:MAG: asparagine synthase-related protein [Brevundimonas sp.]|nr:asparagine synthase-related protein [Brevundimonas sp.]